MQSSNPVPEIVKGEISNLYKNFAGDSLELKWEVSPDKSPQFSYNIHFFDNPDLTGVPVTTLSEISPHARRAKLITNSLPASGQNFKLFITDIFDNKSNELGSNLTGLDQSLKRIQSNLRPNPATDFLNLKGLSVTSDILIFNSIGKLLTRVSSPNPEINISFLPPGIYTLNFESGNSSISHRFVKH